MGPPSSSRNFTLLESALLRFEASPGRFPVRLREPRLLFERAFEVLQLATGRLTLPERTDAPSPLAVQRAARLFVRHAFLSRETDHYSLLGLTKSAGESEIRDHYRLLIRLTHPDFETPGDMWPSDSAARVNLAYGVLSSQKQRSLYDLQLEPPTDSIERDISIAERGLEKAEDKVSEITLRRPNFRAKAVKLWLGKNKTRLSTIVSAGAALALLILFFIGAPIEEESLRAQTSASTKPQTSTRVTRLQQEAASLEASLSALSHRVLDAGDSPVNSLAQSKVEEEPNPILPPKKRDATPAPNRAVVAPKLEVQRKIVLAEAQPLPLDAPLVLGMSRALPTKQPIPAEPTSVAVLTARTAANPASPAPAFDLNTFTAAKKSSASKSPPLDMKLLQPVFAGLFEAFLTGNSNNVLVWAERSVTRNSSAPAFAGAYQKALGDARLLGLGQVTLSPQTFGEQQTVSGVIQMRLEHSDLQTSVKSFRLRAYFVPDVSGLKLAEVVAA
jgi:hypothetical protein